MNKTTNENKPTPSKFSLKRWLGVIVDVKDKNGDEVCGGDEVFVWLPFWTTRSKYRGKVIYKEGEFRVAELKDTEYDEPYKNYEPDNYVRLCGLRKVKTTKYVSNVGKVADEISDNLEYLEVIERYT